MSLHKCPECRRKISDSVPSCPYCGFSFLIADLAVYRQKLEQQRLHNQHLNKQNAKLQLFWLGLFTLIISGVICWNAI